MCYLRTNPGIGMMMIWWLVLLLAARTMLADVADAEPVAHPTSDPYCGLYALYGALQLEGRDVEFSSLLKPEYIGTRDGSSLAELKRAAEEHGVHAVAIRNMSNHVLRRASSPIILQVKSRPDVVGYDHFVLYLGADGDYLRIYDPPKPVELVAPREFASRWSRVGLIVSRERVSVASLVAGDAWRLGIYMLPIVVAIAGLRLIGYGFGTAVVVAPRRRLVKSMLGCAVLFMGAVIWGVGYHFVSDQGFLAQPQVPVALQQSQIGSLLPKVTASDVRELIGTGVVVIDSRLPEDYERGHLPGAISIPINATALQRQAALEDIPKDARLLIYCQSTACPYAERLAATLHGTGYRNLILFPGGWKEWREARFE